MVDRQSVSESKDKLVGDDRGPRDGPFSLGAKKVASVIEPKPFPRRGADRPVEVLPPQTIQTARMTLRGLHSGDRDQFVKSLRESDSYLTAGINVRQAGETPEQCFARLLDATHAGDMHAKEWRRVGVLADGRIACMFHLLAIDHALLAKADAGWWVFKEFAGHGLATEGVRAMAEHAFADTPRGLALVQLDAAIAPENEASKRVARHAGFVKREGEATEVLLGDAWRTHEVWRVVVRLG